jgi:hypothetical protein
MPMSADISTGPRLDVQGLRWRSAVIRIALSSSLTSPSTSIKADSDVAGAVRRSLAAWSEVTGIEFRVESSDRLTISPAGTAGDGVNLISIAPTLENLQLFAANPFGESARTRVFYDRRGAITEGDIVLNPLQQFSTDGTYGTFDLETTLTHEIGHLLGLRHSATSSSIMAERISRNSDDHFGPRRLTEADIAIARDLYRTDTESCCGIIAGRLSVATKPARNTTVWAEDGEGRVVGLAQTDADGSYRLGGLPDAKYNVLALRRDSEVGIVTALGKMTVSSDERANLSKRLGQGSDKFTIDLAGLGLQPSEATVELKPGRQYSVSVLGWGLSDAATTFLFSTKSVRVDAASTSTQTLPDGRDLVSFAVFVDADPLPGAYTLYAHKGDVKTALIGGFVISR